MKQYMKSVVTMALMLLFTLGVWAAPSVNIKKQLNGVDNNDAGEASSSISEGVCTLTVTPASGNYVTVDYITAYSVWDGSMAQAPRRALDLDNSTITVTASASNTDPSGETNYTFTVPTDGSDVEVIVNFQSRKTLTLAMVADIDDLTYNKAAQEPALTITDGDLNLVKDTHYTVAYSNNVNAGVNTAIATITGKGIYAATSVEKTFTINPKALTEEMVAPLADNMVYTGEAQKPEVSVTDGNDDLVYGKDYWTSYTDSINAGEARCEINGKGNYTGQVNKFYTIGQANFGDVTIAAIADQAYTGSQITPAVTVTFNEKAVSDDEYTISYGENINAGANAGTVTLTSNDKNFSTTSTKGATFTIVAAAATITASDQTVTFNGESQAFTNYTIANGTAVVTYYSSEEARTAKTDGTTEAPTNADTYYVQVTQGDNNYTSEPANATFTINPKTIVADWVTLAQETYDYTGEEIKPEVKVKDSDRDVELSLDTDFTVAYSNNVAVGTATASVTGIGNYTGGPFTKSFEIFYRVSGDLLDAAIAGNTYGTFYNNDNDTYLPEGYSAYYITAVSGTTATTQSITYIPKQSPVIVAKVTSTGATAPGEGNMMIHVTADTDVATMAGTIYGLYNGKLMRVGMGTIAAGKNVLQVLGASGAPELSIAIGGDTTGIVSIDNGQWTIDNYADGWYTLDGRKLQQAPVHKGLYIKNGKKVVVNNK